MDAGEGTHPQAANAADGRRLVAVLYADMVGYSRLIGMDDTGTLARLQELRRELIDPALGRLGGTLVNTAGDSLLISFESIISAMRFAVDVQRALPGFDAPHAADRRIRFRMGVNVADVIPDGTNLHGEGVNVAARLQTLCPPGAICVSRAVRDQVRNQIDLPFGELGAIKLKNIAQPVDAFLLQVTDEVAAELASPAGAPPAAARARRGLMAWVAAFTLLVGVAGGGAAWMSTRTPPARTPPSLSRARQPIAVLPMRTIGGGDDYFAEGLTEELIAALGRFPELAVRARSAAVAHKDESPAEIARALAVRYIVEGSVRRASDRLRIAVQLLAADSGTVLWSETYDAEPKDVFSVQDDITRRIVGALSVRLDTLAVASAIAKPPGELEAYDLVLRGRHSLGLVTRVGTSEARKLFEQAIALDRNYAAAFAGLALANVTAVEQGWTGDPQGTVARAIEQGQKAVALQDDNATAHAVLGRALARTGSYDLALDQLKRAVALNPSDPEAVSFYGDVLSLTGDPQAGIPLMEEGARFRPNRPPDEYIALAIAYFLAGRPADAARIAAQGAAQDATLPMFSVLLAMSYAQLGRTTDAAREVANVHRLMPMFDADDFASFLPRPQDRELVSAALRQAGL